MDTEAAQVETKAEDILKRIVMIAVSAIPHDAEERAEALTEIIAIARKHLSLD